MRGRTQKEPNDLWTDGQVFIEMCGRTQKELRMWLRKMVKDGVGVGV